MLAIHRLRELGLKLTPQRLAILEILEGNKEHPSAEDIYKQLKPRYPSLSLTTVYNTLEVLAEAGALQEVRIKADKRHFDPNPAPHGHFLCRICGSIDDVETGPLEIPAPFQTKGYFVEKYAPYFYGICPGCRDGNRRPQGKPGNDWDRLSRRTGVRDQMDKYECSVCGYLYDPDMGDEEHGIPAGTSFDKLPEDWVCPVCGVGKDLFEKVE